MSRWLFWPSPSGAPSVFVPTLPTGTWSHYWTSFGRVDLVDSVSGSYSGDGNNAGTPPNLWLVAQVDDNVGSAHLNDDAQVAADRHSFLIGTNPIIHSRTSSAGLRASLTSGDFGTTAAFTLGIAARRTTAATTFSDLFTAGTYLSFGPLVRTLDPVGIQWYWGNVFRQNFYPSGGAEGTWFALVMRFTDAGAASYSWNGGSMTGLTGFTPGTKSVTDLRLTSSTEQDVRCIVTAAAAESDANCVGLSQWLVNNFTGA